MLCIGEDINRTPIVGIEINTIIWVNLNDKVLTEAWYSYFGYLEYISVKS